MSNLFKSDDLSSAQIILNKGTRCPWFFRRLSKPFTVRQKRFESCVRKNFLISTLKEHRDNEVSSQWQGWPRREAAAMGPGVFAQSPHLAGLHLLPNHTPFILPSFSTCVAPERPEKGKTIWSRDKAMRLHIAYQLCDLGMEKLSMDFIFFNYKMWAVKILAYEGCCLE